MDDNNGEAPRLGASNAPFRALGLAIKNRRLSVYPKAGIVAFFVFCFVGRNGAHHAVVVKAVIPVTYRQYVRGIVA